MRKGFGNANLLEKTFRLCQLNDAIDYSELDKFYKIVIELPTSKPLYYILKETNELLKRSSGTITQFYWLFIILRNPILRGNLNGKLSRKYKNKKLRIIAYDVIKRCIGYLSNFLTNTHHKIFVHYLDSLPIEIFSEYVELINLYITFQLTKITYCEKKANFVRNEHHSSRKSLELRDDDFWTSDKSTFLEILPKQRNVALSSVELKFKHYQYEEDWHIKCAAKLLKMFYTSNVKRKGNNTNLQTFCFYNTMFDYIDYKQDFDIWRGLGKTKSATQLLQLLQQPKNRFSLCNYPFLLSLGLKMCIIEYEVKRIMEYEAEHAFLTSLDKKKVVDVYFRIRVRRERITNDSLKCIRQHQGDLLKSLRVEFINEPGIDAGGLKKEWFLLLTKSLFNPMNGLFKYLEDSRLSWFAIQPICEEESDIESQKELYYLFGVVLALALFNSTILDLKFPKALYKKLCKEPLNFEDYRELYPETAKNLEKMLSYPGKDFEDLFCLSFTTTYQDATLGIFGSQSQTDKVTVELCKGGKGINVTQENKQRFVDLWVDFYLTKSISNSFDHFQTGFNRVCGKCYSISLFDSDELEKLVCGDEGKENYDFKILRSITKYGGGFNDQSKIVEWFWKIVESWSNQLQRKLLLFVTGSDRIPATGISTLPFKVTRLGTKDKEDLPLSHTCFNELCLWEYTTEEKLKNKLLCAITESEGFGFR